MKTNYWRTLAARERKLIVWIVVLFLFYTIAGFFILPPIIRAVAIKDLSENLDRKVTIQSVRVNPFVPTVSIHGLLVQDKDGQPFLAWDDVYVNFEMSSIFRKAWTFKQIVVTGPYARAQVNKDYTFNFSDLLKKYSPPPPGAAPQKPSKALFVRVKDFQMTSARLSVSDYTIRTPFKRVIGPVYLTVSNFCTEPDSEGSGRLFGKTDANEYFAWHGNFCLTPLRSAGNVAIFDVVMNNFKPLYQDILNVEIRSGDAGFCADYRFDWSESMHTVAVTNAAFGASHLRVGLPHETNDIFDLVHFTETGVSGDLAAHHGEIGLMKFSEGDVFLRRGTNQAVNFLQLATPKVSKPVAPGGILVLLNAITNDVAQLVSSTNKWTGIIHEIDFTNWGGHLLDLAHARPATLDLNHIDIDAKNISNIPNTNITAAVSMDWNKNGRINVGVTARISPATVNISLALDQLDLSTLAPYLEPEFNMHIPSANLGLHGKVHLYNPPRKLPKITFQGDTWVDNFHAVDGVKGDDLLKWEEIRVSGIDANVNPPSASIRRISVNNVSAHVIVETNGTINLIASLHPATTNSSPKSSTRTSAPAVAKTSTPTTNAIPPVSIATIAITNAQFNFTDRSVTPNVHMTIENAGGTITDISSTALQHGNVRLNALVDGVGPATIVGRINPFSGTLTNQVSIFMTNMDLVPASPYSGKFAGYRIARGALSVDLVYTVIGQKLQSKNIITLNQFTFGDKVDSPNATKLPVRLAIAILKDRQGRIVLDVPVEGNLNDPKFRIGKVVGRAIANILTKVATSPFSLLGAAFGGGRSTEELRYEEFAPASADLTDSTKKKLDIVADALYNRPGLQLEISGSVDPADDHYGLQRVAFERELRSREWQSLRKSERESITPGQIVPTAKERSHWVKKLYDEALDDRRITPAILAANTNLSAIAARIQSPEAKTQKQAQYLTKSTGPGPKPKSAPPSSAGQKLPPPADPTEALLIAIVPVSEDDLEILAKNRARTVRTYLLNSGKVDTGRLFLKQGSRGSLRQDGSRVYLTLE